MKELPGETKVLIMLMRAALNQEDKQISMEPGCDLEKLQAMVERQSLVTMLYPIIKQQKGEIWEHLQTQIQPVYHRAIHAGIMQEYEFRNLLDGMEQDGLDCLPMKGWIMRNYYPEPLMRSMSDLDVLMKDADETRLRRWMEHRGYKTETFEGKVHDEYRKPPYAYVELHKQLVDTSFLWKLNDEWIRQLVHTLWDPGALVPGKKHIYQMQDEDFYLYHLLHFYKHFLYAGAGIRLLADTYIFLKKKRKQLDWNYIRQQLNVMRMDAFAGQIERLAFLVFAGGSMDQDAMEVIRFLTAGTIHGEKENKEYIPLVSQEGGSVKQDGLVAIRKMIFPPLRKMQDKFPRLHDRPWLLPFYWGMRACRVVLFENNKLNDLKKRTDSIKQIDLKKYNQMKRVFQILKINRT